MRILIITKHIGETAPGIVFEKLILELSKFNKIDIITCSNNIIEDVVALSVNNIFKIDYSNIINNRIDTHLDRIFFRVFSVALRDWVTGRKDILLNDKYDWIFSLCSMNHLLSLLIGAKIKKKYGYKLACYFVDCIPTPIWWGKSYYMQGIGNFVKKYTKYVDWFFSSNEQMLNYQEQYLHSECVKKSVIYTPNDGIKRQFTRIDKKDINFLYTGKIYGLRTSKYLLEAFGLVLKKYPGAFLYFVGTGDLIKTNCIDEIKNHIKVLPFKKDLSDLYQMSTALIDIDAECDNDVFLSSKITNYLLINRPIICETGNNSPARNLFYNKKSIICCNHSSQELYKAMCDCIEKEFDFADREELNEKFSVQSVALKIMEYLK